MKTNSALPFDQKQLDRIRIDRSAVDARLRSIGKLYPDIGRTDLSLLLDIIRCLDLTTLSGDDTPKKVERLCARALRPIHKKNLSGMGIEQPDLTVAALCVYHNFISAASAALKNKIPIAAVAGGFPAGHIALALKSQEIKYSIAAGAAEIDVVIDRSLALTGQWKKLYDELKLFRRICGSKARMKTIIATGNLGSLQNVARASTVAIMAGSDFIKTSTGFEPTNAEFDSGVVMMDQIKRFHRLNKEHRVGFKAAGGIRTAGQALKWMTLVRRILGDEWIHPNLFRIGASGLLNDIEEHFVRLRPVR